jgi:hypothetical protein
MTPLFEGDTAAPQTHTPLLLRCVNGYRFTILYYQQIKSRPAISGFKCLQLHCKCQASPYILPFFSLRRSWQSRQSLTLRALQAQKRALMGPGGWVNHVALVGACGSLSEQQSGKGGYGC